MFIAVPEQTGLLVVIEGEVAGFDVITDAAVYALEHTKLVRSYIIEALAQAGHGSGDLDTARARATAFLSEVPGSIERTFASIGYGTDCRYQKPGLAGATLVHEDHDVNMAFFRLLGNAKSRETMNSRRNLPRRFVE